MWKIIYSEYTYYLILSLTYYRLWVILIHHFVTKYSLYLWRIRCYQFEIFKCFENTDELVTLDAGEDCCSVRSQLWQVHGPLFQIWPMFKKPNDRTMIQSVVYNNLKTTTFLVLKRRIQFEVYIFRKQVYFIVCVNKLCDDI